MNASQSFIAHWYFHLPNLAMAALIYTLIARLLLELTLVRRPDAAIFRVFRSITDPPARLVRLITPQIVPDGLIIVFTITWAMLLRMLWYLACVAAGMRINLGA